MKVLEWLKGKKTYFVAASLGLATAMYYLGWLEVETYNTLLSLLGASGLATMAAKVNRQYR